MPDSRKRLPHIEWSKLGAHKSLVKETNNWFSIEIRWATSRAWGKRRYKVTASFRDGTRICAADESIDFVIAAIRLSSLLGTDSVSRDFQTLSSLSASLTRTLLDVYSLDDLVKFRTGGGLPGPKDILLWLLIRLTKPNLVVETGVAQGVSTTFMLDALNRNGSGRLVSVDFPDSLALKQGKVELSSLSGFGATFIKTGLMPGWVVPQKLRGRWELILGPAQEVLPNLTKPVDLFFHDSLHTYDHMMFEFNWTDQHSLPGTILVSDDISWNTAFDDFLGQRTDRWVPISSRGTGVAIRL